MDANEILYVISPGNDLAFLAKLWQPVGKAKAALTSAEGTATGWISVDPATDTPADPALTCDVTWLADAKSPELWSVVFNASLAKDAALKAVFSPLVVTNPPTPYVVVKHAAGVRAVAKLEYSDVYYFSVS